MVGGWVISITQLGVSGDYFYKSLVQHVALSGDFTSGLGKSIFFGYLIGIIACFKGLNAERRGGRSAGAPRPRWWCRIDQRLDLRFLPDQVLLVI